MRMLVPWVEPARLHEAEVESPAFEDCLARALGLRRFDRKALAHDCDSHYPDLRAVIAGKRPFRAVKLNTFGMFIGCDCPCQWLALQARRAEEECRRLSRQAIGDDVQQMFAMHQAAA